MDLAVRAAALCVTGAVLALVVRQGSPPMGLLLSLGTAAAVLALLADPLGELYSLFRELGERGGLSEPVLGALCKVLGISVVVRLGGSLCRDAGESAMAQAVETAGAVGTLIAALPLLRSVLDLLVNLLA